MLKWFFVIYMMGKYPTITTHVYTQPTEVRCVELWREKIEQFKTTHPEAVITSCKETEGFIVIKPPLKIRK